MDKSWMQNHRLSAEYKNGLNRFLDMAFHNVSLRGTIICPCKCCKNSKWVNREVAKEHLIVDGFMKGYTNWTAHGEGASSSNSSSFHEDNTFSMSDDIHDLIYDAFGVNNNEENMTDEPNEHAKAFFKLIDDAQHELYPGCKKFSKLKFIIRLFHLKVTGKWSNKSFTMLLELLKEAFPDVTESLPASYYDVHKIIGELGLNYIKIDACPNDCMLYWKQYENDISCHVCNASRYIESENDSPDFDDLSPMCKKVSAKVLRYFPLKPRLQRLFMSSKTASFMSWHKTECTKDGYLRHPSDSPLWHDFDRRHSDFANESRNVRLGLAADGFSPFRTMTIAHSTWPVILTPYNMPPWMCMKEPFFFLCLLIPGPSSPGNNIDVYMEPLIDELKELWNGVETYDASTKQNFCMRAALLWTINDFPAYANLSGWSTKGKKACPSYHKNTSSTYLNKSRKHCYMAHRRFLNRNHPYRKDIISFAGNEELGPAPRTLTGNMVLEELAGFNIRFGKKVTDNPSLPYNWKKRSIFFELPYWKDIMLRHNLDVMHIEKNVCDSVIGTLLNLEGKSKDHVNARLDLEDMGIRSELHRVTLESGKSYLPAACFSMSKVEKDIFCDILRNVKVPDGYASNISRCIQAKSNKISGLKSHDNHILMQQLIPIALRKVLPKHVRSPLIKMCTYFRELCSKVLNPTDLIRLEKEIAHVLCELEKIFPPSFFDIMIHLPIHLAYEARIAGPVQYRWMYPIERYLSTLKSYVRNPSRPEGSIAEAYLLEECLTFCSRYLDDVETRFNKVRRNDDVGGEVCIDFPIFSRSGHHIGKKESTTLDAEKKRKAHQYVLFNCSSTESFIKQHKTLVERDNPRLAKKDIERIHSETFSNWFYNHVEGLHHSGNHVPEELRALARGPNLVGNRYRGYIINGFRFHVKEYERQRRTQNSGIVVTAQTSSFSSRSDNNPIVGDVTYYGVLKDILELEYFMGRKIVVFDCDWVSTRSACKKDEYGFTLVNFARLTQHNEPFILASQAEQAFYVEDPTEKGWHVVVKTKARDMFDMDPVLSIDPLSLQQSDNDQQVHDEIETFSLIMAPKTILPGKRGRRPRPTQNYTPDSFDDLTDTQLGLDHIERPANVQVMASKTRPLGNRGKSQMPTQNDITDSFDDITDTQLGLDHIERPANAQVRKPRSTRGRRQRTELNNEDLESLHDSSDREIVQHISRNTENSGETNENNPDTGNKKRKARGPTCMPKVWGLNKHISVSFNDLGQPNDQEETSTLAHFLGTIARNGLFCPLHYNDWRLVPNSYKEDMLKEVKSRFTMRAGSDSYILQSINKKWRNWKCFLKSLNFDPNVSVEEQLLKVPDRVNADQYKKLLDYWNTQKAQQLSKKRKEARAKLEIPHRMGKRSYAIMSERMHKELGRYPSRAELFEKCCYPSDGTTNSETLREAIEKMKELSKQDDEDSGDCDVVHDADDAFAKVMGKDKDGRLRMYGMGVKPSDIYGGRPSRDALYRKAMEEKEEIIALKQEVSELRALVHNSRQIETQRAPVLSHNNHTSAASSSCPTRIKVGNYVKLKSLANVNEIVAIGIVQAIGNVDRNGRALGPGICHVVVQTILKGEEMLIYPGDIHETIGDCIGVPIAWPLSLMALDDDN